MRPEQLRAMYEGWVREHAADLYRCAVRLTGQHDAAEELVQETFYEAWRSIRSLRDPNKARPWLLKILRHRYAHWVRDRVRGPAHTPAGDAVVQQVESYEALPVEVMARQESLQAALNDLDDLHKIPFLLVFLEGMTCQQVADMLEMPLGTVLSRIHRARQHLRLRLDEGRHEGRHEGRDAPPSLKLHRPPEGQEEQEPETGAGGSA